MKIVVLSEVMGSQWKEIREGKNLVLGKTPLLRRYNIMRRVVSCCVLPSRRKWGEFILDLHAHRESFQEAIIVFAHDLRSSFTEEKFGSIYKNDRVYNDIGSVPSAAQREQSASHPLYSM